MINNTVCAPLFFSLHTKETKTVRVYSQCFIPGVGKKQAPIIEHTYYIKGNAVSSSLLPSDHSKAEGIHGSSLC